MTAAAKGNAGQAERVAVLSDSETATGYRLAGAAVIEATPENALEQLERAILEGGYGLIAVDTGLIPDPATATARVMRGRDLPILLPIPGLRDAYAADTLDAKAYMGKLVRETIGFDIKL